MAIEYNFILDMDRSRRDNNIAYARTGDVDSVVINADLVLNGSPYTPTGANTFFECITPNGHSVRASASKTGSKVTAEIPSAAFQAAGIINVAYFRFESGSSDNPTYVESTEPFAIIVREGIGDSIDAGDYIEEWRQLADSLDEMVKEVQQKATQAKTDINEQKEEVDNLKSQAQTEIAQDTVAVENAKTQAISDINATKAEVADAAENVTAAGDQAISQFKTNSQQAINSFNTNGTSAISQFNTNANGKLDEVDDMITEAQGDVNAKISQLETATDQAVSAMEDALDGTTAGSLQNAINRTLKLDVADMTNITNNASLSSFVNVGSYCCKTASTAATISDCPIDDSPFNMYVFSSATSGQVMQLVVPIDLQGRPTAEWHVRFGTSSAMDTWSVIGGGADIAAGLGIDVTGDAQKTVSLDTTAFYQHHEATDIIHGSTEVTGGGRIKELTVFGNTRQNLWVNPSGTANGVTVTANADGSITLSGTATADTWIFVTTYNLKQSTRYTLSTDKAVQNGSEAVDGFYIEEYDSSGSSTLHFIDKGQSSVSFTTKDDTTKAFNAFFAYAGTVLSGTYRVMLNEGSTAQPWCPPGLNGVDELSVVTAGKNLLTETLEGVAPNPVGSSFTTLIDFGRDIDFEGIVLSVTADTDLTYQNPSAAILDFLESDGTHHYLTSPAAIGSSGSMTAGMQKTVKVPNAKFRYINAFWTGESFARFDASCRLKFQLELGSTATAYEPPAVTTTPVDLDGHALHSLPDGTRDELRIDGTGAVTLVQRVGSYVAGGDEGWKLSALDDAPYRMCVENWKADVLNEILPPSKFLSTVLPASDVRGYSNGSYVVVNGIYQLYAGRTGITTADAFSEWLKTSPMTVLYPLATPQEIELPAVSIPSLASPSYMIYASSNVPTEIEAEVVKVDYLPPSDVYTREEVDKKIEDAGGMPDVVPVSQGGTGVTTAAAERNRLGLGNTTGAVPIANGGTGATTNKAAMYNVTSGMAEETSAPADDTAVVFAYGSPSSGNGGIYKRKLQYVWNYIVTKIRSVFGFDSSNVLDIEHGGTGFNDFPAMLVNLGSTSTASPY